MICHLKIQKNPVINHQKGFLIILIRNSIQYKIFAMDNQAGLLDSVVLDKNFKLNPSEPNSILNHTPRSHDMPDQ